MQHKGHDSIKICSVGTEHVWHFCSDKRHEDLVLERLMTEVQRIDKEIKQIKTKHMKVERDEGIKEKGWDREFWFERVERFK